MSKEFTPSDDDKSTKFYPTGSWRLRQQLDKLLGEVDDAAGCLRLSRERKEFGKSGMAFSLRQLISSAQKLRKFYNANK